MKKNSKNVAVLALTTVMVSGLMAQYVRAYTYSVPDVSDFSPNEEADKIESIVNSESTFYTDVKDGVINIDADTIVYLDTEAKDTMEDYVDMLESEGLYLTRELTNTVTVFANDTDLSDYTEVFIGYDDILRLRDVSALKIVFGNDDTYITIKNESFAAIADSLGHLRLQIMEIHDTYSLRFLDEAYHIIPKFYTDIRLGLPAEHDGQTVYLYSDDTHENWGGQYNKYNSSIEVATRYSGEYNVSSPNIDINDIASLKEFEQQAIKFMVIRGYFDADGGKFRPDALLTRYDFAESLVRLFFAQDDDAKCSFTDVDTDSEYYSFVAAAAEKGIAEGFGDGTFRGNSNVTVEQVLALASRTINNKNGYTYPERTKEYLNHTKGTVSDWAEDEVALAVREGIYSKSMGLELDSSITRKDAAVILYRLFMIMNNIPEPIDLINYSHATSSMRSTPWTTTTVIIAAIIAVTVNVVIFVTGIIIKKKRNKVS